MKPEERTKLFHDVFAPKSGEKVLFLVDTPHGKIHDTPQWQDRREMAQQWYITFSDIGTEQGFSVEWMEYPATGAHNALLSDDIISTLKKYDVVIAMTEYSASSSLFTMCSENNVTTRAASMPMVEKRMEDTALKADYTMVQRNAAALKNLLEKTIGAEITFSTGDFLYVDLRNRTPKSEAGDCSQPGKCINLPSGEAWKVPYEAAADEIDTFGESKTEGIIPQEIDGELVKYVIKNNTIATVLGEGNQAEKMRQFFSANASRRNIAEFALGCNPGAVVTGNILEDEKCSGLHIGYAMSTQLGGKVTSDMHEDIVFAKGCPVEAQSVKLIHSDGTKTEIIHNAEIRYELLP